jgi:hypothetical protein
VKKELNVHFDVEIIVDKDKSLDVRELHNNSDKNVSEYGDLMGQGEVYYYNYNNRSFQKMKIVKSVSEAS